MFWLFLALGTCFDLTDGYKRMSLSGDPKMSLYLNRGRVAYGNGSEAEIKFVHVRGILYDIKFDGKSVCGRPFGADLGTCNHNLWEVEASGPFYRIKETGVAKEKESAKCWKTYSLLLFKGIHLKRCSSSEKMLFKIDDALPHATNAWAARLLGHAMLRYRPNGLRREDDASSDPLSETSSSSSRGLGTDPLKEPMRGMNPAARSYTPYRVFSGMRLPSGPISRMTSCMGPNAYLPICNIGRAGLYRFGARYSSLSRFW
jgi:hypothetical protein